MNIYDKLLTELQNQKVSFYGPLIFPNHFRITLEPSNENMFLCMYVIKNHNFSFYTINSTNLRNNVEFFFYYPMAGRNFMFSVFWDLKKSKTQVVASLSTLFPESKKAEKVIESISTIKFQVVTQNKK